MSDSSLAREPSYKEPVLACMNTKGGVGKTTTTVSLGHAIAARGGRVLIVDLDHQSNATDLLDPGGSSVEVDRTVYDLISSRSTNAFKGACFPSAWNKLEPTSVSAGCIDVVPGDPQFLDAHVLSCGVDSLARSLSGAGDSYDLVLLDCPPSTGPVVQSAMCAASHVLLITESKHLALRSFGRTMSFLQEISLATGNQIKPVGILVTKYDNRKTEDRHKLSVLKKRYSDLLLPVRIPDRTAVDAAHSRHIPVDLLPTPQARLVSSAYLSTAIRVLEKMQIDNSALLQRMVDESAEMREQVA